MNSGVKFSIAVGIIIAVILLSQTDSQIKSSHQFVTASDTLRVGYFPNINHAQAVIGFGNQDFQNSLTGVKVETQVFNAGPSAIEALFANKIDVAYVGPNPAINGYIKSDGQGLKIVAGVSSGGASFVIRNDSGITSVQDLSGKKFASPQLGNTQDVALRSFLLKNGYKTTENGGNVQVTPVNNADIFTLMGKKEIDGAWVPEPWATKLEREENAKIFLDERDLWADGKFTTAVIVVRSDYLQNHSDVIKNLLAAHVKETIWINNNKKEAIKNFNTQIEKLTGKTIPSEELEEAFSRMDVTYDPIESSLYKSADNAFNLGFLGDKKPDLDNIFDLTILNQILKEQSLPEIH